MATYSQLPAVHWGAGSQQHSPSYNTHTEEFSVLDGTSPGWPFYCHYKDLMFPFHDATTLVLSVCSSTMHPFKRNIYTEVSFSLNIHDLF